MSFKHVLAPFKRVLRKSCFWANLVFVLGEGVVTGGRDYGIFIIRGWGAVNVIRRGLQQNTNPLGTAPQ